MAFAVKGRRREETPFVEVHREFQLAGARRKLGGKFLFIPFVNQTIESAEVLLNFLIERIELSLHRGAIGIVHRFCRVARLLGPMPLPQGSAIIFEA